MAAEIDLRSLALRAAKSNEDSNLLPVIEKELLHYEILLAMDKARLLDQLVFQGGTCLRLCYGSERYSEDLDFVGGKSFDPETMHELRRVIIDSLSKRYHVTVEVVEPNAKGVRDVYSWQIKVVTSAERPDLPKQRTSIQVAAISAHTKIVRPLAVNYDTLPASYGNVLVFCESPEEVCADKLKAFITAPYVRYRDLWDMRWLSLRPQFNEGLLKNLFDYKLEDYDAELLFQQNLSRLQDLDLLVNSPDFIPQMRRFLPATTIKETLDREIFRVHLVETIKSLYEKAGITL